MMSFIKKRNKLLMIWLLLCCISGNVSSQSASLYDQLLTLRHLKSTQNTQLVNDVEAFVGQDNHQNLRAPAYSYIGKLHASSANWEQANKFIELSIKSLPLTTESELTITALENISWVFFSRGDYANAIYYVQQMADLAYETNNKRGQAVALNRLGISYLELELHRLAIEPLKTALALARENEDSDSEFLSLLYLVNLQLELPDGEPQQMMALVDEAAQVTSKLNIDDGYIDRLRGVVNQRLGNNQLAEQWLIRAHQKAAQHQDVRLLSIVNDNLALFYRSQNNLTMALFHATASLGYYAQLEHQPSIASINYLLSELYKEQGNDDKSLLHLREYSKFQRSASDENTLSLLTMMDKRIEGVKRQQKLVALENEVLGNQLLVQSTKNRQQVFVFVIVVLAICLAFISVLFFVRQKLMRVQVAQSMRDALTGAYNRNYVKTSIVHIKKRLAQQRESSLSLGAILIDCDDFKLINDNYGHAGGDEALKAVVRTIFGQIRENDLLFRWGGDEFVLLCESVTQQQLADLAQRITDGVGAYKLDYNGREITIAVSVGYALYTGGKFSLSELVNRADEFLYQSKSTGKGHSVGEALPDTRN